MSDQTPENARYTAAPNCIHRGRCPSPLGLVQQGVDVVIDSTNIKYNPLTKLKMCTFLLGS